MSAPVVMLARSTRTVMDVDRVTGQTDGHTQFALQMVLAQGPVVVACTLTLCSCGTIRFDPKVIDADA